MSSCDSEDMVHELVPASVGLAPEGSGSLNRAARRRGRQRLRRKLGRLAEHGLVQLNMEALQRCMTHPLQAAPRAPHVLTHPDLGRIAFYDLSVDVPGLKVMPNGFPEGAAMKFVTVCAIQDDRMLVEQPQMNIIDVAQPRAQKKQASRRSERRTPIPCELSQDTVGKQPMHRNLWDGPRTPEMPIARTFIHFNLEPETQRRRSKSV